MIDGYPRLLLPQILGLRASSLKSAASSVFPPPRLIFPVRGHEYLKTFSQPLEPHHNAALPLNLCPESLSEFPSMSHPPWHRVSNGVPEKLASPLSGGLPGLLAGFAG